MSVYILNRRFSVAAAPSEIAAYLSDPEHYRELNPFVIAVTGIRERDGAVEFAAVERIRLFGPIHQNNPLRIVVRSEGPADRVVYDVTTRGSITVRVVTELTEVDEGTEILDTITLTVPRLIRGFALRQARVAHQHRATVMGRLALDS